ncbi:LarC family nickel insertion protein [Aerococcaceae bacterium zg-BR9]|uniref:LarC family nickel insertion protein n=1 Tax=Aerococcaceae bacterium zg-1292 TaxID=2774330 RepID=UPI0040636463|nr:LarC family nickel insertion protein [Aerococcaceae bacterium zg-BR9]
MTTLWIDCKYGIAGDMLLASLIDLGADQARVEAEIKKLNIEDFTFGIVKKNVLGITANYLKLDLFGHDQPSPAYHHHDEHAHDHGHHHHHDEHAHDHVHHHHDEHAHDHVHHHHDEHAHDHVHHHHHGDHTHDHDHHSHTHHHDHDHRSAADIYHLINHSDLSPYVKEKSILLFKEIARAESKIHGVPEAEVHFHEVGALDSIIDIIGVCAALEDLAVDKIYASPVPTGHGLVTMAHGLYPIPAPATAEILVGVPLAEFSEKGELTTPTGAAFLKVLVDEFSESPGGIIEKIGYGAGTANFAHPNVLRTVLLKKK